MTLRTKSLANQHVNDPEAFPLAAAKSGPCLGLGCPLGFKWPPLGRLLVPGPQDPSEGLTAHIMWTEELQLLCFMSLRGPGHTELREVGRA